MLKKNFGFGCMRLPMCNDEIDYEQTTKMVDYFMEKGFNYFDTAHGYIGEKSEIAVNKCLTSRYPRESYILTNKLTDAYFKNQKDIRPLFETQLKACGVDYFDYYLMHAQNKNVFEYFKKYNAYETSLELKKEGKIKHLGISFHDNAEVLDNILTEYPQIEIIQIQFNYADYDDPAIQSKLLLDVCIKHNKPVIVMEPVKGGSLVNLPEEAKNIFDSFGNASYASYAIRFAASFQNIVMVISGMSNMEQMVDNLNYMKNFKPLNTQEFEIIHKVQEVLKKQNSIPCTACKYCLKGCPSNIAIPDLFACYNAKLNYNTWNQDFYYNVICTSKNGKASDCIECGNCEYACPQHLEIRKLLKEVAKTFE